MTTAAPYIVGGLLALILTCLVLLALGLRAELKRPLNEQEKAEMDCEDCWQGFETARKRWEEQQDIAHFSTEASPERIISTRRAA